jgi:phytoene desaturase
MKAEIRTEKKKNVAVIGSGVAGLAAAIRLAAKGYAVDVYEANNYLGGKLSEITLGNYRFDAGPSLFTLPALVDELFTLCGKNPREHFNYTRLDEFTRYFYDDGTQITAYKEPADFAREIENKTGEPAKNVTRFLSRSKELYDITAHIFLFASLHRLKTYLNRKSIATFFKLHKIDALRSMHRANKSHFKDERIITLFNRFATYNGSNPFQAPATLNIIPHLEHNIGAFFPLKGMHDITLSLFGLAKTMGVTFHFNARVEKIVTENKKATGVIVNGKTVSADMVVCNMDIVHAYRKLLPQLKEPKKITNQEKSSSAIIFYWGIKKQFPQLHLHNIFFSNHYEAEFKAIFTDKTIYHDPTVYINITSKLKPDDAPDGCENWFVMINVPHHSGHDWDALIAQSRKNILKKISARLNENIEALIEAEDVLHPTLIESKTSSHLGALYGSNSNNMFSAFLRHANYSGQVKGLYFCGGSVHPGGGIPLSLLSAKIVSGLINERES